jgi:hypothetical protein
MHDSIKDQGPMPPDEIVGDSVSRPTRKPSAYSIVLLVIAAAMALGYWFWSDRENRADEQAAAKALQELGALVIMDGERAHVASVNLSTLQSPDALSKAIEHLPALNHVNSLDASRTEIEDKHLKIIDEMSSLKSLSLSETKITDEGARRLAGLDNLEALHLASTQITGDALSALGELENLRILDLSATKAARNLAPLAELPQLEWLVLRNLTLDEDALQPLGASPSLRRLSLGGSKYPAGSIDVLKRALPELSVDP